MTFPEVFKPFSIFELYETNITMLDALPMNMLPLIHEHWYNFPAVKSFWHTALGTVICIVSIIGLLGNGTVLYLMAVDKTLRTPANILVLNLAFSDFCMMAFMGPTMALNCFSETWILGPLMCEIYGMSGSLFGCVSIWSNVMITLDRYNVIVRGMAASPFTHIKAISSIFFVWIWSISWTLAPMHGWSRYIPEGTLSGCTIDYLSKDANTLSYLFMYAIAVYFIPLFTMIYAYTLIVAKVIEHEKILKFQAKKMNIVSLRVNCELKKSSTEIRLAKIALMTVTLWFVAWTPYLSLAFAGVLTDRKYVTPLLTIWGSMFAKTAACYNPIVYGISHPRYKAALRGKLKLCKRTRNTDEEMGQNDIEIATINTTRNFD
ncbi:ocellar opsin-like [Uloborus diversus]|uniref:ocellar opsin-like n=1 Tax=Uloborus diversus TaxID=327109 RepID=UPI0024094B52|nr:ocellar opsin-like [Uloborus diversus]XP_054711942.1 ocellar opsin-like [Uloborus diversus]